MVEIVAKMAKVTNNGLVCTKRWRCKVVLQVLVETLLEERGYFSVVLRLGEVQILVNHYQEKAYKG